MVTFQQNAEVLEEKADEVAVVDKAGKTMRGDSSTSLISKKSEKKNASRPNHGKKPRIRDRRVQSSLRIGIGVIHVNCLAEGNLKTWKQPYKRG